MLRYCGGIAAPIPGRPGVLRKKSPRPSIGTSIVLVAITLGLTGKLKIHPQNIGSIPLESQYFGARNQYFVVLNEIP